MISLSETVYHLGSRTTEGKGLLQTLFFSRSEAKHWPPTYCTWVKRLSPALKIAGNFDREYALSFHRHLSRTSRSADEAKGSSLDLKDSKGCFVQVLQVHKFI